MSEDTPFRVTAGDPTKQYLADLLQEWLNEPAHLAEFEQALLNLIIYNCSTPHK